MGIVLIDCKSDIVQCYLGNLFYAFRVGILLMRVLALCPGGKVPFRTLFSVIVIDESYPFKKDKKLARFLVALFVAEIVASFGLLLHIEVAYKRKPLR